MIPNWLTLNCLYIILIDVNQRLLTRSLICSHCIYTALQYMSVCVCTCTLHWQLVCIDWVREKKIRLYTLFSFIKLNTWVIEIYWISDNIYDVRMLLLNPMLYYKWGLNKILIGRKKEKKTREVTREFWVMSPVSTTVFRFFLLLISRSYVTTF